MDFNLKIIELEKQIDDLILYVTSQYQNENIESMRKEIYDLLIRKSMKLDINRFMEIQGGLENRNQAENAGIYLSEYY